MTITLCGLHAHVEQAKGCADASVGAAVGLGQGNYGANQGTGRLALSVRLPQVDGRY
jgi:hypothetical protein